MESSGNCERESRVNEKIIAPIRIKSLEFIDMIPLLIDTAQIEGYVSENDNGITVVLDTNLTPELLEEGFVREIISKVQTMRKEADFEVMDRIKVTYNGSEKAEKIFAEHSDEIGGEVLADKVVKAEPAGYVKEWKINGEAVTMGVEKQ